jgi:hypothetical protein
MALFVFLLHFGTVLTMWHYLFFIFQLDFGTSLTLWYYLFLIVLWNCSDSVSLFVSLLDFGTVTNIWHHLFSYWNLIMFRQYGIICSSIWFWNCSGCVALFVFLLYFGGAPTVWHYLYLIVRTVPKSNRKTNNATLSEQYQSPIEKQIMPHCWNSSKVQ